MKHGAPLLAVLVSCATPAPALTAFERAAGAAVLQAWRSASLPEPNVGGCRVDLFSLERPGLNDFVVACGPSFPYSCMKWADSGLFGRERHPRVVLRPGQPIEADGEPIVHELCHAMSDCSGLLPAFAPGNLMHTDPRVWAAAGGDLSAQARARAIVARGASRPSSLEP